jgi:hypothetical protein
MNRLNFWVCEVLTGFGRSNEVPVLYLQGLECLAANYRQSASITIAAICLILHRTLRKCWKTAG